MSQVMNSHVYKVHIWCGKTPQSKAVKSVLLRKPDCDTADNDLLAVIWSLCKANYLYTVLKHMDQELVHINIYLQWKRERFAEEQLYMNGIHLNVSTYGFILENLLWHKYFKDSVFGYSNHRTRGHPWRATSTLISQFSLEYHHMQIDTYC